MKRRDVIKRIREYAKAHDLEVTETEGANHTKFMVGMKQTVVARHTEINEITVKKVLRQIEQDDATEDKR